MTSKLKCPVCDSELSLVIAMYSCEKCGLYCNQKAKDALTQAKQDLEIATKALEDIKNDALTKNRYHIIADINYALEQITHDNSEKPNSHEHKE